MPHCCGAAMGHYRRESCWRVVAPTEVQLLLPDLEIVSKINMCDVIEKPILPLLEEVTEEDGTRLSVSILEYSFA